MSAIKILGIVGSLRKDSYNAFALKAAQELVPDGARLGIAGPVMVRLVDV